MFKVGDRVRFDNPPLGYEEKYPEIYLKVTEITQVQNNILGLYNVRVAGGTDTWWEAYQWKLVGPKYKKNLPSWF